MIGTILKRHALTIGAALLALAFFIGGRVTIGTARAAIDVDVLLVLFALLVTVEILRKSGYLDLAVARTVTRFRTTRAFAMAMLAMTGALSMLVTNDVTLFVVIPFTVAASRISYFDLEDAVILEIVAANVLGCLTPLGNPQNLFVYHQSHWSAATFVTTMLPFVALGAAALLAALYFLGATQPMQHAAVTLPPRHVAGAVAGAICFALVLLEIARVTSAWPAAIAALIAGAWILRRDFFRVDLSIVPLFFFAFIVVAGLRTLRVVHVENVYASAIVVSQFISNVPATVLLSPFARGDWKALLYGANASGCGTIIASLANLLGWRIYVRESNRDPRFFRRLTVMSFAFLVWLAIGGWALLR